MEAINSNSYLIFGIGKELFATSVFSVQEILEEGNITEMPNMPDHILGLMNLRGKILPVVHARRKMNIGGEIDEDKSRIIVFEINNDEDSSLVGVKVDFAKEVKEFDPNSFLPPPKGTEQADQNAVEAVIEYKNTYVLLIDPSTIFNIKNLKNLVEQGETEEINL